MRKIPKPFLEWDEEKSEFKPISREMEELIYEICDENRRILAQKEEETIQLKKKLKKLEKEASAIEWKRRQEELKTRQNPL